MEEKEIQRKLSIILRDLHYQPVGKLEGKHRLNLKTIFSDLFANEFLYFHNGRIMSYGSIYKDVTVDLCIVGFLATISIQRK